MEPRAELVDVGKIHVEGNVRLDMGDIQELGETFDDLGPLQPVVVVEQDGHYLLRAGERRLQAQILQGKTRVWAWIRPDTGERRQLIQLKENLARKALTPLEEALAYADLLENDPDVAGRQDYLAAKVGVSPSVVCRRVGLLALDDSVKDLMATGVLGASSAETIADAGLSHEEQRRVAETLRNKPKTTVKVVEALVRMVAEKEAAPEIPLEALEKPNGLHKKMRENGGTPEEVEAYARLQEIRAEVMEIADGVRWVSPDVSGRANDLLVGLIQEISLLEQATRRVR